MAGVGLNSSFKQGATSNVPKAQGDVQIETPASRDVPQEQQMPKKKQIFTAKKEDPALIGKLSSDEAGYAGQFNGVGAMIDGYLRINKRRYGQRGQYRAR